MARYGKAFKNKVLVKLLPPSSASSEQFFQEVGVSTETLNDGAPAPNRLQPTGDASRSWGANCEERPRPWPRRLPRRTNDAVADFAPNYGTSLLPARPRHQQDKAKAESAVQVVERWILMRLRHQRIDSVDDLDAPALQPLPLQPWEFGVFRTVRVHIDHHVQIDSHRYSVPQALVGQLIEARLTAHAAGLLHRGQRVAAHAPVPTKAASPPWSSTCRPPTGPTCGGRPNDSSNGASLLGAVLQGRLLTAFRVEVRRSGLARPFEMLAVALNNFAQPFIVTRKCLATLTDHAVLHSPELLRQTGLP